MRLKSISFVITALMLLSTGIFTALTEPSVLSQNPGLVPIPTRAVQLDVKPLAVSR